MRIIAHLDMDAFFAAIEERDTPRFRGLPLAVGADPQEGRGRGGKLQGARVRPSFSPSHLHRLAAFRGRPQTG